jgi:hypothetical protein
MEEMIDKMVAHVGIDRATAEKVVQFLREHAEELPKWLAQSGIADRLPGNLGNMLGGFLK